MLRCTPLTLCAQALAVLGLKEGASQREVRTQYLKLAKVSHPDSKTGSGERMRDVNAAYRTVLEGMQSGIPTMKQHQQQPRQPTQQQYQYQKKYTRQHWQAYNPYKRNGQIQGPAGGRSFHYDPQYSNDNENETRMKVCPFPRPKTTTNLFGVEAVGNIQKHMALYGVSGPFKNCVVFIIRHNKRRGTDGVVLNKRDTLELKTPHIWTGCGGPVDYESVLTFIAPGPCVVTEPTMEDIEESPPTARLLAGYLSWSPLTLDSEIRNNVWNVIPVSKSRQLLTLPLSDMQTFAKSISRPLPSYADSIDD